MEYCWTVRQLFVFCTYSAE